MPGMTWTDDADAELRRLWGNGLSAARIAAAMGTTKNAIIGRAHRLNLPRRDSPIPSRAPAPSEPAAAALVKPAEPREGHRGVRAVPSLAALSGAVIPPRRPAGLSWRTAPIHYPPEMGCRWIEGEPHGAETLFCDAARVPHRPYCPAHCARAYQLWRGPDATAAQGHDAPGRSSGDLDVSSQTAPAGQPAASPAALSGRNAA